MSPAPPGPDGHTDAETRVRDADALTGEAVDRIEKNLKDHPCPGNFRELSRCICTVMIRGRYRPPSRGCAAAERRRPVEEFLRAAREVEPTAAELLDRYYAPALDRSGGNLRAAGRQVGRDWRVVRNRHDRTLLNRLRSAPTGPGR